MHVLLPDHLPEIWADGARAAGTGVRVTRVAVSRHDPFLRRALRAAALRTAPYAWWRAAAPWLSRPHESVALGQSGTELADVDTLVASWLMSRVSLAALLPRLPALRWIHTTMTGAEHLDLGELGRRGITLTGSRGVHSRRVGSFTLGLVRRLTGEVAGKTMVVLGTGEVGREVARLARAGGMRTVGVSRRGEPREHFDAVHDRSGLDSALRQADVLVVTLPLTAETRGCVGPAQLDALAPGAVLINVGREYVVDEAALVERLRADRLAGAALDVVADAVLPRSHPLRRVPRLLLTGHAGFDGAEAAEEVRERFVENVRRRLMGAPLLGTVDLAAGY